jgi:hypothetical protein
MTADPVQVIVAGSGEPDHFPRNYVSVAAVDGIAEKPHLNVLDHLLEEGFAVDAAELEFAALEPAQDAIFVGI